MRRVDAELLETQEVKLKYGRILKINRYRCLDNSPIVPAVKRSRIRRFIELVKTIYVHIKQGPYT